MSEKTIDEKVSDLETWKKTVESKLDFLKAVLKDVVTKQGRMVAKDLLGGGDKILIVDLKDDDGQ